MPAAISAAVGAGLATGGTLALVYVLARFAGRSLGVMSLTYLSGVRRGAAGLLCLALTPMSATAVGMVHRTGQLYPDFGAKLAAIVAGSRPAVMNTSRDRRSPAGQASSRSGAWKM